MHGHAAARPIAAARDDRELFFEEYLDGSSPVVWLSDTVGLTS
jgi:hypothetical protein